MQESNTNFNSSKSEREIEQLEIRLSETKEILKLVETQFKDCQQRFQEVVETKKIAQERLEELEVLKLDLELSKVQKMKVDHDRLVHRVQVTKSLLDEAREKIKFQDQVIEDLVNRNFLDFIINRFSESYVEYKSKINGNIK